MFPLSYFFEVNMNISFTDFLSEFTFSFGLYIVYINVINFVQTPKFALVFDGDIIPFFLIFSLCKLYTQKRSIKRVTFE